MKSAQEWGGIYYRYKTINLNKIQSSNERVSQDKESLRLQSRRILVGRNLVRVRHIVVATIFDFMTVEFSLLSPRPLPPPFVSPHSSSLRDDDYIPQVR